MSKNYLGVEDLLSDDSFLSWYFKTDPQAVRQWESRLLTDPGLRDRMDQAVSFLESIRLEEMEISRIQVSQAENRLLTRIRDAENRIADRQPGAINWAQSTAGSVSNLEAPIDHHLPGDAAGIDDPVERRSVLHMVFSSTTKVFSGKGRWLAAATVILLIAAATILFRWLALPHELNTQYGEIREKKLPDGTEVVINADSKIMFSPSWKDGRDREVWLNGEAFFHVSKTAKHSRFIVHTAHFDIIVTGTQFNVVDRPDKANVMLKEGSVTLHTTGGADLKMKPGDFVEYRAAGLEKRPVKNDSILAWKDHKLIFDSTPLREVVKIIQEHYGVKVQLTDDSVAGMTITGILPNDNLEVLLQSLDATLDFEVEHVVHEGGMITIGRRHP